MVSKFVHTCDKSSFRFFCSFPLISPLLLLVGVVLLPRVVSKHRRLLPECNTCNNIPVLRHSNELTRSILAFGRMTVLIHEYIFLNLCLHVTSPSLGSSKLSGYLAYTDPYQGQGHSSRPAAVLINIHEPLIQCLVSASCHQLTSDHRPVCMCHCIFLGINSRVTLHHAFRLYHATKVTLKVNIVSMKMVALLNLMDLEFIMTPLKCLSLIGMVNFCENRPSRSYTRSNLSYYANSL